MIPNLSYLQPYFSEKKKRLCYKDATEDYKALKVHFNGETPDQLLAERRPSETADIWEYRKKIYQPITREGTDPVITCLSKIRRSSDYSIKYDNNALNSKIADSETLEQYCEYNFPCHYRSVTNWAFGVLLKNQLIDANGVILVMPLNYDDPENELQPNEYLEPYPIVFNSDCVYEFIHNKLAVLLSQEKIGPQNKGAVFYVVTDEVIQRWEQKGISADYDLAWQQFHGLDKMPAFRIVGVFNKSYGTDYVDESRVHCMLPRLNEAAREYSDLQAAIVQSAYPLMWEMSQQKCEECGGSGIPLTTSQGKAKTGIGKKPVICQKCNGVGTIGIGPYRKLVVNTTNPNNLEQEPILPPAGVIERDTKILELQNTRVMEHIFKALSTINMQFLAQTPLNQSGKAKEVDKDELNNFIYSLTEDLIKMMDWVYYFCNEFRYLKIVPNEVERNKMLPSIPVPEKFDVLSSENLLTEVTNAKNASLNSVTLQAFEIDFVQKRFYDRPESRNLLQLFFDLDPLPGINEDEKLARLQGNGITQEAYVISSNILPFCRQAIDENKEFFNVPRKLQLAKMSEYAQPIMQEAQLAAKAKADAAVAVAAAQKAAGEPENN